MIFKKLISLSVTSLALSVISALSMILLLSQHAVAADLTVNISDIEQGKGHLLIALYASEEDYKIDKASFYAKVKAKNGKEIAIFENVPDGDYAIKMYQDENDNNKMDFNMMGIPKEGYGFSNNVGMFGAPKYKEAKFMVKENTAITIDLF
ncbi:MULTISPECIES: DUF2141 domain-containing protein [unclassified Colwellia]|uniref:DUF2141 domain-containing protein n=1 Tax=unclassified Colwellia TaxID=196834 RepID=UPI0015F41318|nr:MULTISPECIES: DUF2141 domain-containing protein [unclassified Colwellia]MBA6379444.1 DUF2141 domain-containing protein [Colwellia sp. BRX10-7]MBA6385703.1 DUF2141 domain-containing protein [Colwellia sp. BRX10-2]MBA6400775.1 DUF2141 domain-containing protein [Colwellia sp. BRX10-5]MBA6405385.1 DUF2141 domain-containing protein [Colwellia sp. BRX10-1]